MQWVERFALCPRAGSSAWSGTAFWACYRRDRVLVGDAAVEPEAKARRAELEGRRRARRRRPPSPVRGGP
jgi:hypothetical protein